MRVKGMLMRKSSSIESQECIIEKLIVLPDAQFRYFKNHLMDEWDYISDNKLYMYCERIADGVYDYHCLLVMGENDEDGVIVESEGADYARYTSYLPEARTFINSIINEVAEQIVKGEFGFRNGEWSLTWTDVCDYFYIAADGYNGIGSLLAEALSKRPEVKNVIADDEGITIEPEETYGFLRVRDLMQCDLCDIHLVSADEEHELATIVELNNNTLTAEGKAAWADILDAKVESIYTGDYGLQIEVSGCTAERLSEFSFVLAGYCSDKTYDMWVAVSDEDSPMQME